MPVQTRGVVDSPSSATAMTTLTAGESADDRKDEIGGAAAQRLEEGELPARAEQPGGRAERDRSAGPSRASSRRARSATTAHGIIVSDQTT